MLNNLALVCWIIGEPDSADCMREIVDSMALFHAEVLYENARSGARIKLLKVTQFSAHTSGTLIEQ